MQSRTLTTIQGRTQFKIIAQHTEKIKACNTVDELITYIETNLDSIPTSATQNGILPAEKLITLLRDLTEKKDLVKAVPSAYGLREKVTNLANHTHVAKP